MLDSGAGQAVVFRVSECDALYRRHKEVRLAPQSGDLSRWLVAQPQMSRDDIVPPSHEFLATVEVLMLAD